MHPASPQTHATHRWSWARLLLLVPFVAVLWVPIYNRIEPAAFGIPFFYWYQLLWIVLATVLIGAVYLLEHRADNKTPAKGTGA